MRSPGCSRYGSSLQGAAFPVDAIFGGHVHYAEVYHCKNTNKSYYNTGSFCDNPSHYIIIDVNGKVNLKEI
jgi:UDP-2,3-diacylglucosamine pyrophosphatase LpxH